MDIHRWDSIYHLHAYDNSIPNQNVNDAKLWELKFLLTNLECPAAFNKSRRFLKCFHGLHPSMISQIFFTWESFITILRMTKCPAVLQNCHVFTVKRFKRSQNVHKIKIKSLQHPSRTVCIHPFNLKHSQHFVVWISHKNYRSTKLNKNFEEFLIFFANKETRWCRFPFFGDFWWMKYFSVPVLSFFLWFLNEFLKYKRRQIFLISINDFWAHTLKSETSPPSIYSSKQRQLLCIKKLKLIRFIFVCASNINVSGTLKLYLISCFGRTASRWHATSDYKL